MYVTRGPIRRARQRGMGQDDSGTAAEQFSINIPQTTLTLPTVPAGYTDTTTFTGLPVVWEIGLGLVGAFFLARFVTKAKRRVSAGVRAARRSH